MSYDLTPPDLDSGAELVRAWLGQDEHLLAGALAGTAAQFHEEH